MTNFSLWTKSGKNNGGKCLRLIRKWVHGNYDTATSTLASIMFLILTAIIDLSQILFHWITELDAEGFITCQILFYYIWNLVFGIIPIVVVIINIASLMVYVFEHYDKLD